MTKKTSPHLTPDYSQHHHRTGTTEDGKCLWGHNYRIAKSSCSYRWQAHRRAIESDSTVYEAYTNSSYKPTKIITSQYNTKNGVYPSYYTSKLSIPGKGDWDLTGPYGASYQVNGIPVPPGANFTKCIWPYWHNSHHLIPKGTLNSTIEEVAKPNADLARRIRIVLMSAPYNINHKINMMILPQDMEVAKILNLPRHLWLCHKDETIETNNHKDYNAYVEKRLNGVVAGYKSEVESQTKTGEKHPKIAGKLVTKRLESLSAALRNRIKEKGKGNHGDALAKVFKG